MERNIKLISWLNFFTDFVFFAPVAVIYFAHVTGSYVAGMSIFSVAYTSSAVFEIPTGVVSDLVGRKLTTIFGSISAILCVVLYAIGGSYWMLFYGALIQGLSRAFYSGNNDALLHDSLKSLGKDLDYHSHLGRTGAMFEVGLGLASIAGSFMAAKSYSLVMWISVIPQVCALIVATQLTEPPIVSNENTRLLTHLKQTVTEYRQNYKLQLLTIASMLRFSLGEAGYFLRSAFVNTLWPLWAVGFSNFLSNIGGALSFYFSGKIINKYSHRTVLRFEIISNRIIDLIALIFPTVVSPALMGTTSLTFGVGSVALNSLQQKEFTKSQRATMGSFVSLVGNIMFGLVSVTAGFAADKIGPTNALIIIQVLLLTPLIFYSKIFKKT
jgi:MFS family permease